MSVKSMMKVIMLMMVLGFAEDKMPSVKAEDYQFPTICYYTNDVECKTNEPDSIIYTNRDTVKFADASGLQSVLFGSKLYQNIDGKELELKIESETTPVQVMDKAGNGMIVTIVYTTQIPVIRCFDKATWSYVLLTNSDLGENNFEEMSFNEDMKIRFCGTKAPISSVQINGKMEIFENPVWETQPMVFAEDGVYRLKVYDVAGNAVSVTTYLDREKPEWMVKDENGIWNKQDFLTIRGDTLYSVRAEDNVRIRYYQVDHDNFVYTSNPLTVDLSKVVNTLPNGDHVITVSDGKNIIEIPVVVERPIAQSTEQEQTEEQEKKQEEVTTTVDFEAKSTTEERAALVPAAKAIQVVPAKPEAAKESRPGKIRGLKIKRGGKKITVTWKKVAGKHVIYEIQYGKKAKFKKAKSKKVSANKITIKGLKSGKWYVRVRAGNTGGKGEWKIKRIKLS